MYDARTLAPLGICGLAFVVRTLRHGKPPKHQRRWTRCWRGTREALIVKQRQAKRSPARLRIRDVDSRKRNLSLLAKTMLAGADIEFSSDLFDELAPLGYRTVVVETGPTAAQQLDRMLHAPNPEAELRTYGHTYPFSLAFYNMREEFDFWKLTLARRRRRGICCNRD